MQINPILSNNIGYKNKFYGSNKQSNSVSFGLLMPLKMQKSIKACVFDLDQTLLEGEQGFRNKIFDFVKAEKKVLVYSSARPIEKVLPLVDQKTLIMPDWCICNNGANIYKNIFGRMVEISSWSANLAQNFNKVKVREIVAKIANKKANMFTPDEWAKVPAEMIPEGQKEFRGSKITEYRGHETPLNIRFVFAPTMYKNNLSEIKKELKANHINANVVLQKYGFESCEMLRKYFEPQQALDIFNHTIIRSYPDKSKDVVIISANTDKGKASEYVRRKLKLKPEEVFASGDAGNDYTNANKGYVFGQISNSEPQLINKIERLQRNANPVIVKSNHPGAEGICDILI